MSVHALFIDDDPRGLADLRRLAAGAGEHIVAGFAGEVQEAAGMLATGAFPVAVLGDLRGPGGTSAALDRITAEHPRVRTLHVTSDRDASRAGSAHQSVLRPIDSERLRVAVLDTRHLGGRVSSRRLAEITRGDVKLPSLPDVYLQMQEEMRSDDPSMERIGRLVSADPALSLKVLQIVNSALYGLRNEVGDIAQAARLLGMNTLSSLVLAVGVFRPADGLSRRLVEGMWQEALRVAGLARRIAVEAGFSRADVEATQLGGLLHDLGDLVLYQNWPDAFLEVRMEDRLADERARFGASHADVGAHLAAVWGLPTAVVGAVANHHAPSFDHLDAPTPTTAVHVASALSAAGSEPTRAPLDHRHLDEVGWTDLVPRLAALQVA